MLFPSSSFFLAVLAFTGSAVAKTSQTSGDYAVTVNGVTYNPDTGKTTKLSNVTPTGLIKVRGVHTSFDIDSKNLGVYNYTLTGYPDALRMVTAPTIVFASKVASLTTAQLQGLSIKDLELQDADLVVRFETAIGKFKLQVKDGAQGGIFQMEIEFSNSVNFTHVLGPSLFYFVNNVTGKINFGNGINASSDATLYHTMLIGKDSPQAATKTYQDGNTTKWSVAPGGRLGGVLGEDATELGAGAKLCTSNCQAQNRIRGSIPPTPDPVDPTPLRRRVARARATLA